MSSFLRSDAQSLVDELLGTVAGDAKRPATFSTSTGFDFKTQTKNSEVSFVIDKAVALSFQFNDQRFLNIEQSDVKLIAEFKDSDPEIIVGSTICTIDSIKYNIIDKKLDPLKTYQTFQLRRI